MLHFVAEGSNLPSPVYEPPSSSVVSDNEPIVLEIHVTSEVIVSQVPACPTVDIDEPLSSPQDQTQGNGGGKSSPQRGLSTLPGETPWRSQQVLKETSPPRLVRKSKRSRPHLSARGTEIPPSGIEKIGQTEIAPPVGITPLEGASVQDHPHFPSSDPAKLPKLFEALGRLEARLKSSRHSSTTSSSSEQQRVFQEWARKDFTASFSFKALCDLENVTIKSFKTGRLSKPQHDSFLS